VCAARPGRYRADWYQAGEQPSPGRSNAGNRAVNQHEAARGRGDRQVADQGGLADVGAGRALPAPAISPDGQHHWDGHGGGVTSDSQ